MLGDRRVTGEVVRLVGGMLLRPVEAKRAPVGVHRSGASRVRPQAGYGTTEGPDAPPGRERAGNATSHTISMKSSCGDSRYRLNSAMNWAAVSPSTTRWSSEIETFIMSLMTILSPSATTGLLCILCTPSIATSG